MRHDEKCAKTGGRIEKVGNEQRVRSQIPPYNHSLLSPPSPFLWCGPLLRLLLGRAALIINGNKVNWGWVRFIWFLSLDERDRARHHSPEETSTGFQLSWHNSRAKGNLKTFRVGTFSCIDDAIYLNQENSSGGHFKISNFCIQNWLESD